MSPLTFVVRDFLNADCKDQKQRLGLHTVPHLPRSLANEFHKSENPLLPSHVF